MDAFFSAHKKKDKKKKNKNAATADEEVVATPTEPKVEPAAAAQKPKEVPNFAGDSSDDEEQNIVLDQNMSKKLKDKKDVDAVKRNEEEKKQQDDGLGWGFGGRGGHEKKAKQAEPEAKPKGPREINFGGGKPSFMRAANNSKVVNKNEFPELGDFRKQEVSKKDGNYGAVGSANVSHAPAERSERPRQMEMKKPVFTGFAKLNVGTGDEDPAARKYTYDMDKIRGSTASTKPSGPRPEGERQGGAGDGGERRQPRPRQAAADSGFTGEDDFAMVTDKTRKKPQVGAAGRRFD